MSLYSRQAELLGSCRLGVPDGLCTILADIEPVPFMFIRTPRGETVPQSTVPGLHYMNLVHAPSTSNKAVDAS